MSEEHRSGKAQANRLGSAPVEAGLPSCGLSKAGVAAMLAAEHLYEHFEHVVVRPGGKGDWWLSVTVRAQGKSYGIDHLFSAVEAAPTVLGAAELAAYVAKDVHSKLSKALATTATPSEPTS